MHTVTIQELRTIIPTIGVELTPIIVSEPGCGKTSLLSMIQKDLGDKYDYVYVDCPVKDMQDIAMTIPNHETKSLNPYVGSLFKLDSDKPKIILLDEFMKAPKMLQVIFTRLMLERSVGDVQLPEGSIVFGTSNNQSDGVGDTMLAHAGNRVCMLSMAKPDTTSWLTWASENGIQPLIRAWVQMNPRSLHSILGDNATHCALGGTVGMSASGDMSAFISQADNIPFYDDIIKSPDTTKIPESISAQMMVMFQCTDKIDTQENLTKCMTYMNRLESSEMQALFFTMLMKNSKTRKIASNNKVISQWCVDNHELF